MRAEACSIVCVAHYACTPRAARVVRAISTAPGFTLTSLASKRVRDVGCLASIDARTEASSIACAAHYARTPHGMRGQGDVDGT